MSTQANKPIDTIRDSELSATIWANLGEKGTFYSVDIQRTYTDASGVLKNSHSFSGSELLRVSRLADIAYSEIAELRKKDKANREAA